MAITFVMAMVFAPSVVTDAIPAATAKPVFDCDDPEVRRKYPAMCPELGVPGMLGGKPGVSAGGGGGGSGGGSCGGLCGVVGRVLDTIGLGGIL